jgi:SsrA-binding protein
VPRGRTEGLRRFRELRSSRCQGQGQETLSQPAPGQAAVCITLTLEPLVEKGNALAKNVPKKPKKKDAPDREHDNERLIAQNRKARHEYEVLDTLECGVVLVGSEVKSLRAGRLSLDEAYGRMKDGEVWLMGCDIAEYVQANRLNHQPRRPRKLLMHRREIKKFASQAYEKGLTLVPLKMYFTEGRAKVLMGICRGKKLHDKRETIKAASVKRDIQRAMRRN